MGDSGLISRKRKKNCRMVEGVGVIRGLMGAAHRQGAKASYYSSVSTRTFSKSENRHKKTSQLNCGEIVFRDKKTAVAAAGKIVVYFSR